MEETELLSLLLIEMNVCDVFPTLELIICIN